MYVVASGTAPSTSWTRKEMLNCDRQAHCDLQSVVGRESQHGICLPLAAHRLDCSWK